MGKNWRGAILISIPTFGYMHTELFGNLFTLNKPIHRQVVWHLPISVPVAVARNAAVTMALEKDCEYVYFQDYDVLVPPGTLNKLIGRIEGSVGEHEEVDIMGGMYCSKQKPPWPLIFKDGKAFMGWTFGDVVKCDHIGMGATIIKTELFKRLDPPWFKTVDERPDDAEDGTSAIATMTEDIYFCARCREELGVYPHIDTGLACVHRNFDKDETYYFDPGSGLFVWRESDGSVKTYPPTTSELCNVVDATTPCKITDITTKESEKECEST